MAGLLAGSGAIAAQPMAEAEAPPEVSNETRPDEKPDDAKQDVPKAGTGQSPAAVLKAAREKLLGFRSIKAKIIETVALGDRRFKAEGSYQQGSNLRLRLEFTVKSGESTGSILEVCDGQVLWSRYTVGKTSRITRRDVRQILDSARVAVKSPENLLVAELGLGGLPALLASVEQSMAFRRVREEEIDGQKFTVLEGGWSQQFLDEWKKANPKSANRLPEHVPESVRLYLDSTTLLPRRFLFLKRDLDTKQNRPMVTVDFVDLVLNAPISDDEFYFIPPENVPQEDITQDLIKRLRGPATSPNAGKSASAK